jgi:hypothetical protein
MTKYVKTETRTVGGKTLTVMIRKGSSSVIADTAAEVLEEARKVLKKAHAFVHESPLPERTLKLAERYFLTPSGGIPEASLDLIKSVIGKTRTGLSGDVVLKTGDILSGEKDDSTRGQVLKKDIGQAAFDAKTLSHPDRNYQTFVKSLDPAQGNNHYRRGAMHVTTGRLKSLFGVKTFIHEATHKYAGTIDYVYFDDDGATPIETFDDPAKALINADSHAWFICTLGWHMSIS